MPVATTLGIAAGVVGYTTGTVVWSLSWAETETGVAPIIDTSGVPAGKAIATFTRPGSGGALGTATITATVDGLPAGNSIVAVAASGSLSWAGT